MRSVKIGKNKIILYDGIEEIPAYNFSRYNFFLMLDSGIGGDIDAIAQRLGNMQRLAKAGEIEKHEIESNNLLQAFAFIIENTTPKHFCFVPWIASINGKQLTDLSDESVKLVLKNLSEGGLKVSFVRSFLDEIKKKFQQKWTFFSRN